MALKKPVVTFGTISETKGKLHFTARVVISEEKRGKCETCGGKTLRSFRTGMLHFDCYGCRYLKMIYGPGIKVDRG